MEKGSTSYSQTILISVITLLIGAFIGLYFDSLKARYKDKIEYFDLRIRSVDNYLKTPSIAQDELDIIWKDQKINNISSITIELYNFSNLDFEDVPIIIELFPRKREDIKVIAHHVVGEETREDLINNITSTLESNKLIYEFSANLFNRTKKDSPNVIATFLIAGEMAPKPNIFINKKGVKTRRYDSDHTAVLTDFEVILIFIFIFFAFVFIDNYRTTLSRLPNSRLIIRLIYVLNCFIRLFGRIKRSICGLDDFFA